MTEYLSKFREEEPAWIKRYLHGEQITFKDIMSSRVAYYPGSGYDGTLLKVGNMSHSVHSFLYVDYGISRKELENHLAQKNSIRGYHPIGRIEWEESNLLPNGQYPMNINKKPMFFEPTAFVDPNEKPYCFSLIMERDEDQDAFVPVPREGRPQPQGRGRRVAVGTHLHWTRQAAQVVRGRTSAAGGLPGRCAVPLRAGCRAGRGRNVARRGRRTDDKRQGESIRAGLHRADRREDRHRKGRHGRADA